VCLRIRTFASSAGQARTEVTLRNGINLTDQPEPRGSRRPGRRPHVPSSKPTMSKSRRASSPGSIGSGHRLYRPRRGTKRWPTQDWAAPVAGGAYMCGPQRRQRLFVRMAQKTGLELKKAPAEGPPRSNQYGAGRGPFKGATH